MTWQAVGHIVWELLYWPGGIVVGNLIANVFWETPRNLTLEWRLRKHHKNTTNEIKDLLDPSTPGGITDAIEVINGSKRSPESTSV